MKKRMKRYAGGGGVPTTGASYDAMAPAPYPFPSQGGDPGSTTNTTVNVNGQKAEIAKSTNPFENLEVEDMSEEPKQMRRGGKVKTKKVRGDGIAQRGRTKGRFV